MVKLAQALSEISDIEYQEQVNLTKFSTMRLKACGNLLKIKSYKALQECLPLLKRMEVKYRVLGLGANQLLPENTQELYLKLELPFDKTYLDEAREIYNLPASVPLSILSSHAIRNGLKGWESFTGIPATLGGAIFMNAGTGLGEIGPVVKEVKIMAPDGSQRVHTCDQESFSYRRNNFLREGEVIFEATLIHFGQDPYITKEIKTYLDFRNKSQPLKEWTCGCVFKNHKETGETCRAGQYIDIIGLKGLEYNGVRVSPKHANFMENFESASLSDMKTLIMTVQEELKMNFGLDFETEVKIPKE